MLRSSTSDLSKFFVSRAETDKSLAELGHLEPAYRAVMVSDGTLTHMLSALHLEDITTQCFENGQALPGPEQRQWLDIGSEPCVRRQVELTGALSGTTYVRALSYLYPPRLPSAFLMEMSRAGSSLGTQLLNSRISHRRELIWLRSNPGIVFSRLYRILLQDRPAILIQEDFLEPGTHQVTLAS
jgi:chorismate-pyruvate lyase